MGFVHDQLFDGPKIRVLTVTDTLTRLSQAIELRQSFRSIDVVATPERVTHELVCPKTIPLDGPRVHQQGARPWAFIYGVTLDFSRPAGRPTTPPSRG